jgi:hypothetical protein
MAPEECVYQRERHAGDFEHRYQTSASDLPEWRLRKVFAPEDLPSGDGLPVGTDACGQLTDSAW